MRNPFKQVFIAAIIIGLAIMFNGCDSRVSQDSFEKIHSGMAETEVREILGEPTETSSFGVGPFSGTSSVWKGKRGARSLSRPSPRTRGDPPRTFCGSRQVLLLDSTRGSSVPPTEVRPRRSRSARGRRSPLDMRNKTPCAMMRSFRGTGAVRPE
jgi:hypothetical protein